MVHQAAKTYDPVELEKRIQEYWETNDIYHRVKQSREGGEDYYFVDGPPYTTGHIHLGTAWNKTLKDAQLRYLRSMGYNVRDQAGFDMHGLPIEVKVEQELGIENKKAIDDLGIDLFIEKCKEFALGFQKQMAEQFKALGVWLDWENPYLTIMNYYIQGAWWTLKRAHEKELLYTAERVLSWCPRCETALAEAEVEYWDETDPSIYVKFPIEGREKESIVIWTTTPWTLMANMAVAVSTEFDYVRMLVTKGGESEVLIVMESLAKYVAKQGKYQEMEILETIPGEDLEGLKYLHPFADIVPFQQRTDLYWLHKVILADYVTADEENNTGCVHTAPGHGPDDFETGKRYDLPPFCPVDGAGKYTEDVQKYAGRFTKDADQDIIQDLIERGLLLNSYELTHRYGHCWRCKKPITYRTTTQWFLKVTEVRDRMLEENAKVHWTPEWAGSNRFRSWLENTRDWCISRQRYWGIPMPIWKCSSETCDNIRVVANAEELREGNGYLDDMDLHRPWIDNVTFPCDCGAEMNRVKDVLDVWFDSAVCSWAQLEYPINEDEFNKWWPTRWITEAQDQTRGWFYSQLGASVVAFDRAPYNSVLMHGWALDEKGKPMSKSAGNIVKPSEVAERFGVDSLRFYLLKASAPWEDLAFSMEGVRIANRTLNIFWNVYYFSTTYMSLDGYSPEDTTNDTSDMTARESIEPHLTTEDRWLLSRLESTVKVYNDEFRVHNLHRASRAVEHFILEDLSRWYVRLIRDRTWSDDPTASEEEIGNKNAVYYTLHRSLVTIAEIMSPIIPHLSEEMYRNLVGKDSVSIEPWREADEASIDTDLESEMAAVRDVIDTLAAMRQKAGIKLRWPLSEVIVETKDATLITAIDSVREIILSQGNIKDVRVVSAWDGMEQSMKPNYGAIGPVFKAAGSKAANYISSQDQTNLMKSIEDGTAEFEGTPLTMEMLTISEQVPETHATGEFPAGRLFLNIVLSPELEAEAFGREIIRRIQEMRKEANLKVDDRISTTITLPDDLKAKVEAWKEHIAGETRSTHLSFGKELVGYTKDWEIEDYQVKIGIEKKE
jgi:isoleucyl-tRNA synthetase